MFDLSYSDRRKTESQGCFDLRSPMTKDFEHFFKCFLTIQNFSLVNSLFSPIPHFVDWIVLFLEVSFLKLMYIIFKTIKMY